MIEKIIKQTSSELDISESKIKVVLELLSNGNTVPFISRYRKEVTGNLDEEQIRNIHKRYDYFLNFNLKKENIKKKILEKELLTDDITIKINNALTLSELEDIYMPFKEKKETKATKAIAQGLEPLSKLVMKGNINITEEAKKYESNDLNLESILLGAGYIIAQNIGENSEYRKKIRDNFFNFSLLKTKVKKNIEELDPKKKYEIYYNFSQSSSKLPSYRILAITRAEKEKIISVSYEYEPDIILGYIKNKICKNMNEECTDFIKSCLKDAYTRLILPSIKRELRRELNEKASDDSIEIFSKNLEKLVMQKPLKDKTILAIDPAFRTGCKYAVVSKNSQMLITGVVYPHPPVNKIEIAAKEIKEVIAKYKINQIVLGNGTASRETEEFVANLKVDIPYSLISEAGASVYSASVLAQKEFPHLSVEYRSAISIGRRIQDPMSELVKIDPKSIGVGQYQHDVDQKKLSESLDFQMHKLVNRVGVDINTASKELLEYVSGLDKKHAKNIVDYREEFGSFENREQIKLVKRLGEKAYEQAAGFLKIIGGYEKLDETFIHPDDYDIAKKIIQLDYKNLTTEEIEKLGSEIKINDIIEQIEKPNIDIRQDIITAKFSSNLRKIEDLKEGTVIEGEVRNILEFGAFVDIGLKNDALVHISEISDKFVSDVMSVLKMGDIKKFKIIKIDMEKEKINLSLKGI